MTGDTEVLIIHLFTDIMMVSTILTGGTVGTEVMDMDGTLLMDTEAGGVTLIDLIIGEILIIMAIDIATITMEEDMLLIDLVTITIQIEDIILAEEVL